MARPTSSFVRLGVVALTAALLTPISGCTSDVFGTAHQDLVPKVFHPSTAQIEADPCLYGDLPRCAARCDQQHDAASCNTAAVLHEWGATDYAAAAPYYWRACSAAYAPGCTGLAWLHLLGHGVKKDPSLAMKLFNRAYDSYRLACNQGALGDCVVAADMLIDGLGVDNNEALAMSMLDDACSKGSTKACDRAKTLR